MTFEEKIKEFMRTWYKKGSGTWEGYEYAKKSCIMFFTPTYAEYPVMIKIIADWLEL
jgi:hypothetical protein